MSEKDPMSHWYYLDGNDQHGPVDQDVMLDLAARGRVHAETRVWRAGLSQWTPAAEVAELRPFLMQPAPPPPGPGKDTVSRLSEVVGGWVGTEQVESKHVEGLFSQVLRRHDDDELERVFSAGLSTTTPPLESLEIHTPTPWVFSRLLVFFGIAFAILAIALFEIEGSDRVVPGLILTGSFASPLAAAVFLYECNIPRNISLFVFTRLFVWGGVLSILLALALFPMVSTMTEIVGPSIAGLVEEPAKLAAVVLLANASRFRWTLNGMCLGAAVGAGFAAFESAGYALEAGLEGGAGNLVHSIALRGLFAPFGHVVWTAICAGALWRVRRGAPFDWDMLKDRRCLSPIVATMVLHALWNSPLPAKLPLYTGYVVLGTVGWIIAIGMMLGAIRELRDAKSELRASCSGVHAA
jgi:RsiW-degrading membrane proteinase PrsW (M82 family)